jgi:hypothetical protein
MLINKTVRSALVLIALGGAVSACAPSSGTHSPQTPAANSADGSGTILSQEVTQKASVKIASITDAQGRAVSESDLAALANESVGVALAQLRSADRAVVTKEAVQIDGAISERMVIDLRDKADSIIKLNGDVAMSNLTLASSRSEFPVTHAEIALGNNGKIGQMLVRLESGRAINVILAFGTEQQAPKQEVPKQEAPKQEMPKQEAPKQELPKQEAPKQEMPKQEAPKQELPKQEAPKQELPKQEAPKQEMPKQEAPKQELPKQEAPKQEMPKQEAPKQELPKQEAPKQELPKQEAPKQEAPKQEAPKQS